MAERKAFLIRVDPATLDAVQRWANDDLRSLNSHIEYLLRDALKRAGRQPKTKADAPPADRGKDPSASLARGRRARERSPASGGR